MIDSDLQETIAFIKERHKIFLEKKAKEKEQEFKKSSYLDLAETKKDLKYLVKAKDIVNSSIEKVTEKGIDLEYDDEEVKTLTEKFTNTAYWKDTGSKMPINPEKVLTFLKIGIPFT